MFMTVAKKRTRLGALQKRSIVSSVNHAMQHVSIVKNGSTRPNSSTSATRTQPYVFGFPVKLFVALRRSSSALASSNV